MGNTWKSPVTLENSKADIYMFLHECYDDNEIKKMSTLKVNMIVQRKNEPVYKEMIDAEVKKAQQAENGRSKRTNP